MGAAVEMNTTAITATPERIKLGNWFKAERGGANGTAAMTYPIHLHKKVGYLSRSVVTPCLDCKSAKSAVLPWI
jgi:hypothetical protein